MITFLIAIIIILTYIIYIQYKFKQNRSNNIRYIYTKLKTITKDNSSEKLLIFTDDKEIKSLLLEINNLLNYNQKILVKHTKVETDIKKMLSNISHDLKTPLTVILGYIETMLINKDFTHDDSKKFLLKIHSKSLEVLTLINKFFDLVKLESGDKSLTLSKININEVCRKNILNFYDILVAKGFKVDINIQNEDVFIMGNLEALDRILNNLISNAIKYGSDGSFIGLNLKSDKNFAYIDICDKGKGIEEINKDKVFERMYTLDDSRNSNYAGSGLGLTITKRLIESLGGEISLYSVPYKSTIFTVKLNRIK